VDAGLAVSTKEESHVRQPSRAICVFLSVAAGLAIFLGGAFASVRLGPTSHPPAGAHFGSLLANGISGSFVPDKKRCKKGYVLKKGKCVKKRKPPPPRFMFGCEWHTLAGTAGDWHVEGGFCPKGGVVDKLVLSAPQGGIDRCSSAFIVPAGRMVPCQMANSTAWWSGLAMQPTEALDVGIGGPGVASGNTLTYTISNANEQEIGTVTIGSG
jgi:hypothetical protein